MKGDDRFPDENGGLIGDIRSATGFLTRLPPRWIGVDPGARPDFRRAARVFPVVGAAVGAVGGVVLAAVGVFGIADFVAAALAVGATVVIAGGLHEDGLADAADSLGGATVERRLAIMDDSRIGTYGAVAVVLSLLIRVGALAAIATRQGAVGAALVLVAAEAASRAAMVRLWHDLPAARTGGLADVTGPPDHNAMLTALAIAVVIAAVASIPAVGVRATAFAVVLAALATYMAIRVTARMLGGRTGDTLGACQQVALAAFLVGAATV
jgi:adenosylcobinamide-GDP ribazoletransferase